jgi:hypothetical protein
MSFRFVDMRLASAQQAFPETSKVRRCDLIFLTHNGLPFAF